MRRSGFSASCDQKRRCSAARLDTTSMTSSRENGTRPASSWSRPSSARLSDGASAGFRHKWTSRLMSSRAAWPRVPPRGKRLSVSSFSRSITVMPSARDSRRSPNMSSKTAASSPCRCRSSDHSLSERSVRKSTGSSSRIERIHARDDCR